MKTLSIILLITCVLITTSVNAMLIHTIKDVVNPAVKPLENGNAFTNIKEPLRALEINAFLILLGLGLIGAGYSKKRRRKA